MAQLNFPEAKYLGDPSRLDSKRYVWCAVKMPKGKSWEKDAIHFRDNGYVFSKISFFDNTSNLYVRFTPSRGLNGFLAHSEKYNRVVWYAYKQSVLYLTIKNYAEISACQVLNDIWDSTSGEGLGRHFEEGILNFWKSHSLPFGYTKRLLRDM